MASGGGQHAPSSQAQQPNPEIFVRRLYKPRLYDQVSDKVDQHCVIMMMMIRKVKATICDFCRDSDDLFCCCC